MSESSVTVKKYTEDNYNKLNFESIQIGLASPEKIRSWSFGEVKKAETINYRTLKPEKDGLFCEVIFGPVKDWECHCGKYKRQHYKGTVCDRCGVKVTKSKVRRERMGRIELACPVSHIWYFKGIPSRIGLMLGIAPRQLERVIYFDNYIVLRPGDCNLNKGDIIDENTYQECLTRDVTGEFEAMMGAEAIKILLSEIDVEKLAEELKEEIKDLDGQQKLRVLKRLEVVEAFRQSGNRPEWMILDVIPVIPPDLRPMVQLDGGRFATSDLNDLYRRVINRNERLKTLLKLGSPESIVKNEKRMLQEAVDALIDNGRRGRPVTGPNNRPLKSLSDMLKGKQGRFRQNLLGKRVDFSGRSVIVVGPTLKIYQCGLPKEMALELFKPFVMKRLCDIGVAKNIKAAKKLIERVDHVVWDALETVIKDHPVMLNRAPTLHRLGIQAFEPVLVEGRAIKLHPLVCTAFNADFDGDQMAVHVPLSVEAQAEARFLMLASNNLLKPSDGKPVTVPSQDMVLGSYYLTLLREDEPGANNVYRDENEAIMAYDAGVLGLHAPIKLRITKVVDGVEYTGYANTTLGRVIFNRPVPQDLGFVKRDPADPDSMVQMEAEFVVDKKQLGKIIDKCIEVHGTNISADVLDRIKNQGYKYSTQSGITVSVFDAVIPEKKAQYLAEAQKQVDEIMQYFNRGYITEERRYKSVINIWEKCTNKISEEISTNLDSRNPIHMMLGSGARGNASQLNQLAGMRGPISNTSGQTIEIPIKANYREGLNVLEYFISSRGARKGLADTALRTADSGYLTRRLVDISQEIIVLEDDCGCTEGFEVFDIYGEKDSLLEGLAERLEGRYLFENLYNEDGSLLMDNDHILTGADAKKIVAAGHTHVKIRSLLTCEATHGVCKKCYGKNLATGRPVSTGEAVGVVAAQSIGEPGTQLTMRTFHTGGVATTADITRGLPRVEELFEARKPKTVAFIARATGTVSFKTVTKGKKVTESIVITTEDNIAVEEKIPFGCTKLVQEGQHIEKGALLTEGSANPHDVLDILGVNELYNYLIKEVQAPYRAQGVELNDKHIEVIVRQMMRKVKVDDAGSASLLSGATIEKSEFKKAVKAAKAECEAAGTEFVPASYTPVLLGITKASLATESFLAAASFQETTRVLTDAAIKGKVDPLVGLKENVIIGKLLPSGTGMKRYSGVTISKNDYDIEE